MSTLVKDTTDSSTKSFGMLESTKVSINRIKSNSNVGMPSQEFSSKMLPYLSDITDLRVCNKLGPKFLTSLTNSGYKASYFERSLNKIFASFSALSEFSPTPKLMLPDSPKLSLCSTSWILINLPNSKWRLGLDLLLKNQHDRSFDHSKNGVCCAHCWRLSANVD